MKKFDIIIVGGGPGGSTLASYLVKNSSAKVALFEKEPFPRFHIGESLLPSSMPIFREIGFYDKLNSGKYITKYGARFVDYRSDDEVYFGFENGLNPDIPTAFEVPRAEFDNDLLNHARSLGVEVFQPERVKEINFNEASVSVTTTGGQYEASFIVDASGRDSLLGKRFNLRKPHSDLNNVAVFAHYTGVKRMEGRREGDITIGLLPERAWSWVIPFQGERTSVGVVCSSKVFRGGADLAEYLTQSMATSSFLREMMKDAYRENEVTMIANYSHHSENFVGDRWMLIGDAAVFLDPIFSSGVHVSITSAKLAAPLLIKSFKEKIPLNTGDQGTIYQRELNKGVSRFHSLISLFYDTNFVAGMTKTLQRENMRKAFTSAVAGDMWNDENFLFQMNVLGKDSAQTTSSLMQ